MNDDAGHGRTVLQLEQLNELLEAKVKSQGQLLAETQERLRTLFENAPLSIQLIDVSGRTLQVNAAWRALWRIPPEVVDNFILRDYNVLTDPQLEKHGILPYFHRALRGENSRIPAIRYDAAEPQLAGRARWVEGNLQAAADNGFDHERERDGDWLRFGSSHAPLEVWLTANDEGHPLAGLSRVDVARALGGHGELVTVPMPPGAQAVRRVKDVAELHRLLRRAYQLARALPDELLHAFGKKTHLLPRNTEAERLVVERVGQDLFRAGLLEYWEGRCAITGLAVPELLRASHIKPWADCDTDAERLDVFNGLLLAPHLDAAFDRGFIGVEDDGAVVVSDQLPPEAQQTLGLAAPLRVKALAERHRVYLPWHRSKVFKR